MALPLAAIGLGLSAAGSLAGLGFGISQRAQARRLERNNQLPMTSVNNNILQNVAQAEQMARTGLPSQVYNNQLNQINTGLTAGLRQVGRLGSASSVASVLRGYNAGIGALNASNVQNMQANQRLLMQQRGLLANEQERVFNWNRAQPYLRTMQQVASLRNAGNQNIFGAIGNIAGMGMNLAGSDLELGGASSMTAGAGQRAANFGGLGLNMPNAAGFGGSSLPSYKPSFGMSNNNGRFGIGSLGFIG